MTPSTERSAPLSGAERQRRFRERQRATKNAGAPVTPPSSDVSSKPGDVTLAPAAGVTASLATASPQMPITPFVAAVALAGCAAYFSVRGMVVLFPGAPLAVAALAVAMEVGKLVTVAFLARYSVGLPLRVTLVVLVAGIAAINGLGVFSQLVGSSVRERRRPRQRRSMPGSNRKPPSWPISTGGSSRSTARSRK